jgi:aspartate aminotransferase-like enzyme
LKLLAQEDCRSDTVTAVRSPATSPEELKEFTSYLKKSLGVEVAGGQDDLQGHIFRVGHLGWVDDSDATVILEAVEAALIHCGLAVTPAGAPA